MMEATSSKLSQQVEVADSVRIEDNNSKHSLNVRRRDHKADSSPESSSSEDTAGPPSKLSKITNAMGNVEQERFSADTRGPLTASIGADGEDEGPATSESAETEEALMALPTDKLVPKVALPSLKADEEMNSRPLKPFKTNGSGSLNGNEESDIVAMTPSKSHLRSSYVPSIESNSVEGASGANNSIESTRDVGSVPLNGREDTTNSTSSSSASTSKATSPQIGEAGFVGAQLKDNTQNKTGSDKSVTSENLELAPVVNAPKSWKGKLLGPMEPMELSDRRRKTKSSHSSQEAAGQGLPKILEFRMSDPQLLSMSGGSSGSLEHDRDLPSLKEDSRLASALARDPGSPGRPALSLEPEVRKGSEIDDIKAQEHKVQQHQPHEQHPSKYQHQRAVDPPLDVRPKETTYEPGSQNVPDSSANQSQSFVDYKQVTNGSYPFGMNATVQLSGQPMIPNNRSASPGPVSVSSDTFPFAFTAPQSNGVSPPHSSSRFNYVYPPESLHTGAYSLLFGNNINQNGPSSMSPPTSRPSVPPFVPSVQGAHGPPHGPVHHHPQIPTHLLSQQIMPSSLDVNGLSSISHTQPSGMVNGSVNGGVDGRINGSILDSVNVGRNGAISGSANGGGFNGIMSHGSNGNIDGHGIVNGISQGMYEYRPPMAHSSGNLGTGTNQVVPSSAEDPLASINPQQGYRLGIDQPSVMAYPIMFDMMPEVRGMNGRSHFDSPHPSHPSHNDFVSPLPKFDEAKTVRDHGPEYDLRHRNGLVTPATLHGLPSTESTMQRSKPHEIIGIGTSMEHAPPNQKQTEAKTHKCTYPGCSWSFARSSDHKRHIRSHGKPSLKCPYWQIEPSCNKKGGMFYRLDVLKRHLRLVHLIRPTDGTQDGGRCRVCLKVFSTTRAFIDHCEKCAQDYSASHPKPNNTH